MIVWDFNPPKHLTYGIVGMKVKTYVHHKFVVIVSKSIELLLMSDDTYCDGYHALEMS